MLCCFLGSRQLTSVQIGHRQVTECTPMCAHKLYNRTWPFVLLNLNLLYHAVMFVIVPTWRFDMNNWFLYNGCADIKQAGPHGSSCATRVPVSPLLHHTASLQLLYLYSHVSCTCPPSALYESLEQRQEDKIVAVFVYLWFKPSVCSQVPSVKSVEGLLINDIMCRLTLYMQLMQSLNCVQANNEWSLYWILQNYKKTSAWHHNVWRTGDLCAVKKWAINN